MYIRVVTIHNRSIIAKPLLQSAFIRLLRNYTLANLVIESWLLFHARNRTDTGRERMDANKATLKNQLRNCPRYRDILRV